MILTFYECISNLNVYEPLVHYILWCRKLLLLWTCVVFQSSSQTQSALASYNFFTSYAILGYCNPILSIFLHHKSCDRTHYIFCNSIIYFQRYNPPHSWVHSTSRQPLTCRLTREQLQQSVHAVWFYKNRSYFFNFRQWTKRSL